MFTNQASLKKLICQKMFHITYIKTGVAPVSFLAVSNSLILVNYKKHIFRILQILLTAGFVIYYYEIYSDSFIPSFIQMGLLLTARKPTESNTFYYFIFIYSLFTISKNYIV